MKKSDKTFEKGIDMKDKRINIGEMFISALKNSILNPSPALGEMFILFAILVDIGIAIYIGILVTVSWGPEWGLGTTLFLAFGLPFLYFLIRDVREKMKFPYQYWSSE